MRSKPYQNNGLRYWYSLVKQRFNAIPVLDSGRFARMESKSDNRRITSRVGSRTGTTTIPETVRTGLPLSSERNRGFGITADEPCLARQLGANGLKKTVCWIYRFLSTVLLLHINANISYHIWAAHIFIYLR
ncbi:unnamed protein product [Tuber aestivum]|uniref:Uncharacterized protein n=1 Tax=Tuber aestivum TaxID=59557 RepID=A0A292PY48_9PEZI|nr:unnamed protein product [Tuber aestivum]